MGEVKKAHCPAPGTVVAACHHYFVEAQPQSPAKSAANLISEGLELVAEAAPDAPKLADLCRIKYPHFGNEISTHIPSSVRERARHVKRAQGFASLQDLYLEAILKSLTKRGLMGPELEPSAAPQNAGA